MDRIQDFALLFVAVAVAAITIGAGAHVADMAQVASLPVVQLERVVVVAPPANPQVASADTAAR